MSNNLRLIGLYLDNDGYMAVSYSPNLDTGAISVARVTKASTQLDALNLLISSYDENTILYPKCPEEYPRSSYLGNHSYKECHKDKLIDECIKIYNWEPPIPPPEHFYDSNTAIKAVELLVEIWKQTHDVRIEQLFSEIGGVTVNNQILFRKAV